MQRQENNIYCAGFFVRLAAWGMDSILVGTLFLIIKLPMLFTAFSGTKGSLFQAVLFQFTVWDIIFYILAKIYYVATTYCTGATVGKRLMNIKVIPTEGDKLTLWNVVYRETIGKYLSDAFLCIGYIMIGIDREKRGFHDMLSDTRVIYNLKGNFNTRTDYMGEKNNQTEDSGQYVQKNDEVQNSFYQIGHEKKTAPEEEVQYQAPTYGYSSEQKPIEEEPFEENSTEIEEKE